MSENNNNNNDKQSLEMDPIVQSLLPNYLKSRRLEIFKLQRLLADNCFEKIRIIGHNLRGSGGLYGLERISEIGKQIEESALISDQDSLGKNIQALHYFLSGLDKSAI